MKESAEGIVNEAIGQQVNEQLDRMEAAAAVFGMEALAMMYHLLEIDARYLGTMLLQGAPEAEVKVVYASGQERLRQVNLLHQRETARALAEAEDGTVEAPAVVEAVVE